MRAKIVQDEIWGGHWWVILYNNGKVVTEGPTYTRRDSAKRGLFRFLRKIRYEFIEFEGVWIYEKLI